MDSHLDLPGYCCSMLDEILNRTGYPFRLSEVTNLEFDSELKVASKHRPYHSLEYLSAYRDHRDHFVVNAKKKVLRLWDVPPDERYVPASSAVRGLPEPEYQKLRQKCPLADQVFSVLLFGGLVRQLTSFPTDLRVERELSQELLKHKDRQLAYLRAQVRDFLPTLDERMLSVFPEGIYRASTAMNIAFAEEAADLAGESPGPIVKSHSSREKGEVLLHHLKSIDVPGLPGDRALTDAWARDLGLEGWYEWRLHEVD